MNFNSGLYLLLIALPVSAAECDQVWRGMYVYGAEVETFQPCGSEKAYWVSYAWAGIPLKAFHQDNTDQPYEAIYLEFRGQLLDEKVDGFAENYDGLIRVSEILDLQSNVPDDCGYSSSK